ncbi:MAG: hypothetical protein ACRD8A_12570 [Candidatus Acidiferrales bacterium]
MFGNDAKKVADIEAKVQWLVDFAVYMADKARQFFKIDFPPPPGPSAPRK